MKFVVLAFSDKLVKKIDLFSKLSKYQYHVISHFSEMFLHLIEFVGKNRRDNNILKGGLTMKRVSVYIATFLFLAWLAALFLNIDIYRKANIELSVFGPIIDAILLMFLALVVYMIVAVYSGKSENSLTWINRSLFLLGICSIFMISFFYVATFR